MASALIKVLNIEGDLSNFTQCNILSRGIIFKTEIFNGFVHINVVYIFFCHRVILLNNNEDDDDDA